MENNILTKFQMSGLNAFDFQIQYTETNQKMHFFEIDLHTHNEFELYINLSGDVSFLVENTLYPVSRGDVNGDATVDDGDALYLLRHTLFSGRYPLNQSGDMNGDGTVTDGDALYLLRYTLFPDRFPLHSND